MFVFFLRPPQRWLRGIAPASAVHLSAPTMKPSPWPSFAVILQRIVTAWCLWLI
jgi:hypothetical protein